MVIPFTFVLVGECTASISCKDTMRPRFNLMQLRNCQVKAIRVVLFAIFRTYSYAHLYYNAKIIFELDDETCFMISLGHCLLAR